MTFHGSMPALDSCGAPGNRIAAVLTGLLSHELGFKGLWYRTPWTCGPLSISTGRAESVKRAVAAGADVLIQPVDVSQAIDAIVAGVQEDRFTQIRIDSLVRRILELKHSLRLDRQRFVNVDSLRDVVGDSANQAIAHRDADNSITLVKDSLHRFRSDAAAHVAAAVSDGCAPA